MRVALVVNPRAGSGRRAGAVARRLQAAGADVVEVDLEALGDPAAPRPETVDLRGSERIVVGGGDGSIGLAAALAAHAGLPLAVVAVGTANDFARALGLPRGLDPACRLAATGERTREIELADADGRPFVNAASVGLSPLAARMAEPLKPRIGRLAYPVGALRAAIAEPPFSVRVRREEDEVFCGEVWQVTVAATGAFGAGAATGGTRPDDGALDVAVVAGGSRLALARRARAMRAGRLVEDPGVEHHRGAAIAVQAPPGAPWNVDGEVCALPHGRFAVTAHVKVIVP